MDEAPGWKAIDQTMAGIYGDQPPRHFAPPLPAMLGGPDPLDGISAWPSTFGGRPHWHFVTYGFSELYTKETDDPNASGYGFELTMRVVDPTAIDEPPAWVFSLLQNLARYVFSSGNAFSVGHSSTLNGPIVLERETELVAALFVEDPELPGSVATPHGTVQFVQLTGITADEYEALRDWNTTRITALLAERDPALLTDLTRTSMLADPAVARQVEEGIARDGSSMDAVFTTRGAFEGQVWEVAANGLDDVKRVVRGRLAFGRDAMILWPGGGLRVCAGPETAVTPGIDEYDLTELTLSPADQAAILAIPVARGDHPLPSGEVTVRVVPIQILDGQRQKVEREIG